MIASKPAKTPVAIVVFDIDGVVRDVAGSYRRAIADTVEHFTQDQYRPTLEDIDTLKSEGCWNNDWDASRELIHRFYQDQNFTPIKTSPEFSAIVDFFQSKYRGLNFSGYIQSEPLLMSRTYLETLTQARICWGFFSGATQASASYVLEQRLGLDQPTLVAMEDAPGKPDPTGLFQVIDQLSNRHGFDWNPAENLGCPIVYVGDTVADMQTIQAARQIYTSQDWIALGVLPPHVLDHHQYSQTLLRHGAHQVLANVQALTAGWIADAMSSTPRTAPRVPHQNDEETAASQASGFLRRD